MIATHKRTTLTNAANNYNAQHFVCEYEKELQQSGVVSSLGTHPIICIIQTICPDATLPEKYSLFNLSCLNKLSDATLHGISQLELPAFLAFTIKA